ncbi:hypothetical protein [Shewanella pealeana]|nr:hypothetical protein [Shewanella pealeana]
MRKFAASEFFAKLVGSVLMVLPMALFTYLASQNEGLAEALLLLSGSVGFCYALIGYSGYCTYYRPKRGDSPLYSALYTLCFALFFIPWYLRRLLWPRE